MTFTPTSAADFTQHFEANNLNAAAPFYYELSTNTVNFGYGINLTAAEDAFLNGNPTLRGELITWLSTNGIPADSTSVAGVSWASLSTASLTTDGKPNGTGATNASTMNNSLPAGNYSQAAMNVFNSYFSAVVAPELTVKVPNLLSLPSTTQWALESMFYDHSTLLGKLTYTAAKAGNLAGIAEQLAFNASPVVSGSSGLEERFLGCAMLALGFLPTFDGANQITQLTSDANVKNQANNVAQFIYDVLNPNNLLGHPTVKGGAAQSAQSYIQAWNSSNVSASYQTLVAQLDQYLIPHGYYVVQPGDTASTIFTAFANAGISTASFDAAALLRINAPFGVTGYNLDTLLHVPIKSFAVSASAKTPLPALPAGENYVFDAASQMVYVVGGSINSAVNQYASGALIVDAPDLTGHYPVFAKGTCNSCQLVPSTGDFAVNVTAPNGTVLFSYDTDPSATFSDGIKINLPTVTGLTLTDNLAASATPQQVLLSYLGQLASGSVTASDSNSLTYNANGQSTDVIASTGVSINIPTAGSLSVVDATTIGAVSDETVTDGSGGMVSFTDASGNQFASYTGSQAAGDTIQTNGSEIDVYNATNQIENSTQEIKLGSGVVGVLDDFYNHSTQGIIKANTVNPVTRGLYLTDNGTGIDVSGGTLKFYQNGTETPITISGIGEPTGTFFVDDKNEIIESQQNSVSVIYSGAGATFTGGTTTTLLGPNGQPLTSVIEVSPDGNLMVIGTHLVTGGDAVYSILNGTLTNLNIPTYTNPDGSAATFYITGLNDNGIIVGSITKV